MNWLSSRFLGCLGRPHTDSWLSIKIYCDILNISPTGFPLSGAVTVHGGRWFKVDSPLCLGKLCLSGVAPAPEDAVRLFQQQKGPGRHMGGYEPCPSTRAIPQPFCTSTVHTKRKSFELAFCSYTISLSFPFYKGDGRMWKKFKCYFASVFAYTLTGRRNKWEKKK